MKTLHVEVWVTPRDDGAQETFARMELTGTFTVNRVELTE
jgi:hypothetical protein